MISTHVLDTSSGFPASGVKVWLEKNLSQDPGSLEAWSWKRIGDAETNSDGRIVFQIPAEAGTYRLVFHLKAYFEAQKLEGFFPVAPVIFSIQNTQRKYHVPLLLSPYGMSTYRGS